MNDSVTPRPPASRDPLTSSPLGTHLARSAALVAAFFAADKALGLLRDAVIGHAFGASAELDAYYAAFELPDGLFNVVAGLAMATALIPVLSAHIARDDRQGTWTLVSAVINWVLLIVASVSVLAAIFAPQIIQGVAPGFDAPRRMLATQLMRLVLIQTLVSSVSGVVMSVLQAHQHFLLPAVAPLAYTLGRIGGALFLAERWGIFGLAWGGLAGTAGHFLIQLPGLIRYRARWRPVLRHNDLPALLRLMGPRMLGMGVTYLNFVLPTFLGSRLAGGAISAYEYGWRLMQFPETIIGTALGLTVFPSLAGLANVGDTDGLRRTASWALRLVLALALPAAVVLLLLGRPLTSLFLQRGAFDAIATQRVYWALQFFALGLVTHSALEVAARVFYAQRDMWTPLWAAIAGFVANGVIGWFLLPSLEHGAMALSNGLGAGLQVVILLVVARRRMGSMAGDELRPSLLRSLAASLVMAALVGGLRLLLPEASPFVTSVAGLALGAVGYVLAAVLLGSEELRSLPRLLLSRASSR